MFAHHECIKRHQQQQQVNEKPKRRRSGASQNYSFAPNEREVDEKYLVMHFIFPLSNLRRSKLTGLWLLNEAAAARLS